MRQHIARHFDDKVFYGGLTYNSHPMGCAAALATIQVYEEDHLIENSRKMGAIMQKLGAEFAGETSVGGRGAIDCLFGIVELIRTARLASHGSVQRTSDEMVALGKFFRENGLYTFVRGIPSSPILRCASTSSRCGGVCDY